MSWWPVRRSTRTAPLSAPPISAPARGATGVERAEHLEPLGNEGVNVVELVVLQCVEPQVFSVGSPNVWSHLFVSRSRRAHLLGRKDRINAMLNVTATCMRASILCRRFSGLWVKPQMGLQHSWLGCEGRRSLAPPDVCSAGLAQLFSYLSYILWHKKMHCSSTVGRAGVYLGGN